MKIDEEAFEYAINSLKTWEAHQAHYDIMNSKLGTDEDKIILAKSILLRRFLLAYLEETKE